MNNNIFESKKVVITGKFEHLNRKEAELRLNLLGATVSKSISSKTDVLIAGKNAGSKLAKAEKLGIKVMDESALMEALKNLDEGAIEKAEVKEIMVGATDTPFSGKNMVVTGDFSQMKRKDVEQKLKEMGAKVSSSVSQKTDIIIAGWKAGSKLLKGMQNGTQIIWAHDFYKIMGIENKETEEITGPLSGYLMRFYKMVEELMAHPEIEITYFYVAPPVQDRIIKKVINYIPFNGKTNQAIINFYKQANGLSLAWRYKDDKDASHGPSIITRKTPYNYFQDFWNDNFFNGAMNIYPIDKVFNFRAEEFDYDEPKQIGPDTIPDNVYTRGLRYFDYYSDYSPVAFHTAGSFGENPPLVKGNDHSCFTDSLLCDFETYMEYKLANYCVEAIDHRSCTFFDSVCGIGKLTAPVKLPSGFWNKSNSFDLDKRKHGPDYPKPEDF